MMFKAAISLLSLTVLSKAQLFGLSNQCTTAIATIATSPEAACLNLANLLPVFLSGSNSSIVQPLDTWLGSFCATSPCSNQTLADIATNVTQGCASDISSNPSDVSEAASFLTTALQQYYGTARKILCLKDGNTNCITQTLINIQNIVGPIGIENAFTIVAQVNPENLPKNITCTNCVKAAYNVLATDYPDLVNDAKTSIQNECGASFTDGTNPSDITQTAVGISTLSKDSGAPITGVNTGAIFIGSLLGVAYLFA